MNTDIFLSEKLNSCHLNLHTLSERSGVAYSTVYNLFTGKKSVAAAKTDSLYRIARVLGISMDEVYRELLFTDTEQVIPNFLLMWEDEVVASVQVGETVVSIQRFDLNPIKQIFYKDEISRFEFGEILKLRCWDEHRADIKDILKRIGLDEFNPYKICRITHGKMVQDKTWFKFDGETICYADLIRRKNAS